MPLTQPSLLSRGTRRMILGVFTQIFRTLWAHKLRSLLTMFGVARGVASLLLLVGPGKDTVWTEQPNSFQASLLCDPCNKEVDTYIQGAT